MLEKINFHEKVLKEYFNPSVIKSVSEAAARM